MYTFLMIIVAMVWGASIVCIKLALQEINTITFIFFRFCLASILMLLIILLKKEPCKRPDIIRGTKLGFLIAGVIFSQTIGLKSIPASLSSFLMGFSVVFILIIKFITQKKIPTLLDILISFACLLGLGLVTHNTGLTWKPGIGYSLMAAFFLSLHTYTIDQYARNSNAVWLVWMQLIFTTFLTAILCLSTGIRIQFAFKIITWGAILFCAIFSTCVAFWLQTYCQKYLGAFKVAIILTIEPVFATLFSCLVFDEVLHVQFYLGAMMLLGSILLINLRIKQL